MVCHSTVSAVEPTHQLWIPPKDVSRDTGGQEQNRKLALASLKQQTDAWMHTDALTCLPACIAVSHSAWQMCAPPESCRSFSWKHTFHPNGS